MQKEDCLCGPETAANSGIQQHSPTLWILLFFISRKFSMLLIKFCSEQITPSSLVWICQNQDTTRYTWQCQPMWQCVCGIGIVCYIIICYMVLSPHCRKFMHPCFQFHCTCSVWKPQGPGPTNNNIYNSSLFSCTCIDVLLVLRLVDLHSPRISALWESKNLRSCQMTVLADVTQPCCAGPPRGLFNQMRCCGD